MYRGFKTVTVYKEPFDVRESTDIFSLFKRDRSLYVWFPSPSKTKVSTKEVYRHL